MVYGKAGRLVKGQYWTITLKSRFERFDVLPRRKAKVIYSMSIGWAVLGGGRMWIGSCCDHTRPEKGQKWGFSDRKPEIHALGNRFFRNWLFPKSVSGTNTPFSGGLLGKGL